MAVVGRARLLIWVRNLALVSDRRRVRNTRRAREFLIIIHLMLFQQLPPMPQVRIALPETHSIEWGAVSDYLVAAATFALVWATVVLARYTRFLVIETRKHREEH